MADYSPHRPHPSGRGWDAGCSTRQGPRKCRANTSRAQEPRLVSHLSGDEGGDETACSTPGRRPHRIRSFDETEALAQCLAGELLAVEGPALRELLRPGKGHGHRHDIAKVQRVTNRSSLGKGPQAIGQRLQLFRMAR